MALGVPKLKLRRKSSPKKQLLEQLGIKEIDFGERPAYLEEYMRKISEELGETPELVDKPSSELKRARKFNVVYPVGGGVFIHAYTPKDPLEAFNIYGVIEPPRPDAKLLRLIDEALAIIISEEHTPRSAEEKKALLLTLIDEVITPVDEGPDYGELLEKGVTVTKVPVKRDEIDYLKYHVVRDKVGVGVLEPFLRDPYLEDITCNGAGPIYVVHKIFGNMKSTAGFKTHDELDDFIVKLGEKIGKPISHARPVIDATLPDGSRINIVYGKDVSLFGSNFTIRRVAKIPISVTQLINWGTFDEKIAAYMWMMLREGMSVFICGETASGKTTSLNAIAAFIKPTAKIVTIEDTAEVVLPHPNWTRELTRDTGRPETSVTMFDLLRAALRQRPNYIIVGEIRGAEGNIAFQAMQTGHPVMATFHAADLTRLIQRLTNPPISVPKTNMDSLNIAWFQSAVYTKTGLLARRVIAINEIIGYDPASDGIAAIPVFTWDPVEDRFIFAGKGASYLLEEKIGTMRGLTKREMKIIYDELEMRAAYLRELVNRKIFEYPKVFKAIVYADRVGIETALKRIRQGQLDF
ncbi:MAG: type II/IV secretion system ATPase subunit [Desulfurococcales archaeon]|nr:type II/IV secretion system ATPase subunit [Desulfurococcales archaeon]